MTHEDSVDCGVAIGEGDGDDVADGIYEESRDGRGMNRQMRGSRSGQGRDCGGLRMLS